MRAEKPAPRKSRFDAGMILPLAASAGLGEEEFMAHAEEVAEDIGRDASEADENARVAQSSEA